MRGTSSCPEDQYCLHMRGSRGRGRSGRTARAPCRSRRCTSRVRELSNDPREALTRLLSDPELLALIVEPLRTGGCEEPQGGPYRWPAKDRDGDNTSEVGPEAAFPLESSHPCRGGVGLDSTAGVQQELDIDYTTELVEANRSAKALPRLAVRESEPDRPRILVSRWSFLSAPAPSRSVVAGAKWLMCHTSSLKTSGAATWPRSVQQVEPNEARRTSQPSGRAHSIDWPRTASRDRVADILGMSGKGVSTPLMMYPGSVEARMAAGAVAQIRL
jgi:hypothetical protein